MKKTMEIAPGWACETHCGVYRFGHIPAEVARELTADDELYVVVTINWTLARGEKNHVHRNYYFALTPLDAAKVALAVNHPNEDVVEIRRATDAEAVEYFAAWELFEAGMPADIPHTKQYTN